MIVISHNQLVGPGRRVVSLGKKIGDGGRARGALMRFFGKSRGIELGLEKEKKRESGGLESRGRYPEPHIIRTQTDVY